jgi:hypothetical protein
MFEAIRQELFKNCIITVLGRGFVKQLPIIYINKIFLCGGLKPYVKPTAYRHLSDCI